MSRFLAICMGIFVAAASAQAEECPGNPDALGTSRTIVVDPTEHPRLGSMQYRDSLPLQDHEVVITFDDGPLPPRSTKVLDTLAHECVKVNYFLVGTMAKNFPAVVRRIRDEGHTIGTHSNTHPLTFHKMSVEKAAQEINDGIAAVKAALGDGTGPAPFFRIPGLLRADGVERYLASQQIQIWSADFTADDWTKINANQVYQRALQQLEINHRGILLLHDIHPRTVDALPNLLQELKRRGYRVVHVVPATAEMPKTETEPSQWLRNPRKERPQVVATDPNAAPDPDDTSHDGAQTQPARKPAVKKPAAPKPVAQKPVLPKPNPLTTTTATTPH